MMIPAALCCIQKKKKKTTAILCKVTLQKASHNTMIIHKKPPARKANIFTGKAKCSKQKM